MGSLLLAFFPTDVPATPISGHRAIHLLVAILAFLTGGVGALALSLKMGANQTLRNMRRFAISISVLAIVSCLVELLTPFFAPHFAANFGGLFERLFLGTIFVWIAAISASNLKTELKPVVSTILSSGLS